MTASYCVGRRARDSLLQLVIMGYDSFVLHRQPIDTATDIEGSNRIARLSPYNTDQHDYVAQYSNVEQAKKR